jgi:hypothetical protein
MSTNRQRRSRGRTMPGDGFAEHARSARAEVGASIDVAWVRLGADRPGEPEEDVARNVLEDPSRYPWRLVDAAMDRLVCEACGGVLGSGPRGCGPCDLADGFRFAAQELDRDGVPRGNEHAIRVSSAVLRSPLRYPDWAVRSNEVSLPLFLAGDMPTRREQETMLAAWQNGWVAPNLGEVRTFADLAARAQKQGGVTNRS